MNERENAKLERFISAVNDEIDVKASAILAKAEEEKNKIISAAETEAEKAAEEYTVQSRKKNGNKFVKELSRAELDMKRDILRRREELTDKVFEAVEKRLAEYRTTNSYADGLIKTLLLMNVSRGAEIRLAEEDMKYVPALEKIIKAEGVTFVSDSSVKLGGFSVYYAEKGIIIDKTFDLAAEEQKNAFVAGNVFAE